METADLLADKMQIGRPELCESRLVFWIIGAIAQRGNVVDQRVKPYVCLLYTSRKNTSPLKNLAILGSTGSIGQSTLSILSLIHI